MPRTISRRGGKDSYGGSTPTPIMEVYGNSVLITNGDASPSAGDHTDFGSTPVATTVTRTFRIESAGNAALEDLIVTAPSGYTVTVQPASSVAPSGSTTFSVRFNATTDSTVSGDILIESNVDDYVFAISAIAAYAPLFKFTFVGGSWPAGGGTYNGEVDQLTVVDSGSFTSLVSGEFRTSQFVGFNDPRFSTVGTHARRRGLVAMIRGYLRGSQRAFLNWHNGSTVLLGWESASDFYNIGGDNPSIARISVGGHYGSVAADVAIVFDSPLGGGIYVRPNTGGDWILEWLDQIGSGSNAFFRFNAIGGGVSVARMQDLGGWQDEENILLLPSLSVASPINNNVYSTSTPSAMIDMSLTAPGSLGVEAGVRFHIQDSSNYWRMYFDSAGAFKVDVVTSGTPSNQVNVAAVITAGATRRIRAKLYTNRLEFHTKSGSTWTKRGSTLTSSVLDAYDDVMPEIGSGWSASNLRVDPTYSAQITSLLDLWATRQAT